MDLAERLRRRQDATNRSNALADAPRPPTSSHPSPPYVTHSRLWLVSQLLGCSIDSKFSHLAWVNTPRNKGGLGGIGFPLLADVTKSISKDYGVLIEHGDDAGIALRCVVGWGLDVMSGVRWPVADPPLPCPHPIPSSGLFIINPEGVLRQITVNDLPVGRSVDETLRLVKAFQFVDKHGEVCPANWTPGAATMKADPKGSMEYFAKQ